MTTTLMRPDVPDAAGVGHADCAEGNEGAARSVAGCPGFGAGSPR